MDNMIEFAYAYAYFVIYAFLGWVCEDLYCGIPKKKFINRGFLYGPYCPIYGVGALLVLYPLLFVKQYPVLVFILGVIITSTLEYITSWVMEKLFKTRWWDYSEHFLNINGRVCLLNSTLFGIMSIVVVYIIHPAIEDLVHSVYFGALTNFLSAFTIGFGIDCAFTVIALLKRKKVFERVQSEMEEIKQEFESESHLRVQEAQDAFQEWLQSKTDRLEQLQTSIDSISTEAKKHISKAFPERLVQKDIREWIQSVDRKITYMKERKQLCSLSCCVKIYNEKGQVLICEEDLKCPGGMMRFGEDFEQKAKMYVKEKTGLNIANVNLYNTRQWEDNKTHYIEFIYKTNEFSGELNKGYIWTEEA